MFWGTPSFFWDKKSTMILFENFKKHPPTPRVLLGLCSIKKVPAPPRNYYNNKNVRHKSYWLLTHRLDQY